MKINLNLVKSQRVKTEIMMLMTMHAMVDAICKRGSVMEDALGIIVSLVLYSQSIFKR